MIRTPYRYNTITRWAITIPTLITAGCAFAWLGSAYQIWGVIIAVPSGGMIGFLVGKLWRAAMITPVQKWILDYAYAPDDFVVDTVALHKLLDIIEPGWREIFTNEELRAEWRKL